MVLVQEIHISCSVQNLVEEKDGEIQDSQIQI